MDKKEEKREKLKKLATNHFWKRASTEQRKELMSNNPKKDEAEK